MTILANLNPTQQAELTAAVTAAGGDGVARGRSPKSRLVGIFGTSQAQNNHYAGQTFTGVPCALTASTGLEDKSSAGFAAYCEMLTGGRVEFPRSLNYGVNGYNTRTLLPFVAQAAAAMKAAGCGCVVLIAFANETLGGVPYSESIVNGATIEKTFTDAGIVVIWLAEYPRGNAASTTYRLTGTALQEHMRIRRWLADRANNQNVFTVDPWPILADPLSATGDMKTGLSVDYLHLQGPGSVRAAQVLTPVLNMLFPPAQILPVNAADVYSTANPVGIISRNPMLDGTAGVLSAGNTGSVADNWGQGATPSGLSAAMSKITDADGYPGQRIVISGTAAATTSWELMRTDTVLGVSDLAIGSIVKAAGELQLAAGATGILACYLHLSAGSQNSRSPAPFGTATLGLIPDLAVGGPVVLPTLTVPAGATLVRCSLYVTPLAGATVNATITLKRFGALYA